MGHLHRFERLGQRSDLIDLHEDGVGGALLDAHAQAFRVGDEQIVADQLHLAAELVGQRLPAGPVILGHAVLDGDDRPFRGQRGEVVDHAAGIEGLALAFQLVDAIVVEFGRGAIEREDHILTHAMAGGLAGLGDEAERLVRRADVRREAALVADIGRVAGIVQRLLQRHEHLGPDAHGVGDRTGADRHDHEFLDVDRVVGVLAAIDDVHHRHRQGAGKHTADMAVERDAEVGRRRLGDRERDRQHRIGAEARLVGRAVQLDHRLVDLDLVEDVHAGDGVEDLALDIADGLEHALAAVAGLVAVAQFHRLMRAGRGAGGDDGVAARAAVEHHLGLDGRVAAGVEDFTGDDVGDGGHGGAPAVAGWRPE